MPSSDFEVLLIHLFGVALSGKYSRLDCSQLFPQFDILFLSYLALEALSHSLKDGLAVEGEVLFPQSFAEGTGVAGLRLAGELLYFCFELVHRRLFVAYSLAYLCFRNVAVGLDFPAEPLYDLV